MKVVDQLIKNLRNTATFNPDAQVAPACILWPDPSRQWESIIPSLQEKLPELMCLGDYTAEKKTGPAIWLRCAIANCVEDLDLTKNQTPILYLPGVGRQDLRAIESCPENIKPLAELQYRGIIWSQVSAKDWTILAFLKSDQGGLGLHVSQNANTKNAMRLAMRKFLNEDLTSLKGKYLDQDYFNALLSGGDFTRNLLQWIDQGDSIKEEIGTLEWNAFVEICVSQLSFNPQSEGLLAAATNLASHNGPWSVVWDRYCEAPIRYQNIPHQIRRCAPPLTNMLWHMSDGPFPGWPQWNEQQEKNLHQEMMNLAKLPPHLARKKILELEKQHGHRRSLIWAELNEAPLACALEHLASVAKETAINLAAGTVEELATKYANYGWQVDDAVLRSLAYTESISSFEAIKTAIRSCYLSWLEDSARYLQDITTQSHYPGGTYLTAKPLSTSPGDCVLFVDGLRFDAAMRLKDKLNKTGFSTLEEPIWSALPSMTATGKPAVTPVHGKIRGEIPNPEFVPNVIESGSPLIRNGLLKKLLNNAGWATLTISDNSSNDEYAWCETGDIDSEGHHRGWKLAKHLDPILIEIHDRIAELLAAGWKRVQVVTDHGWILLPGGLPKIDLPKTLTESKGKRYAAIKPGVSTDERLYQWYWNPNHQVALANGIACFQHGEEYAHGGLSLQECLTLKLIVTPGKNKQLAPAVEITDSGWKGLRFTIAVDGNFTDLRLDIREEAGNAESSIVLNKKKLKENGTASVVIDDDSKEGQKAMVVLLGSDDSLIAQLPTIIGGEN
ncbi:BREX-1 system phosphatase PglZ type B [Halodesulfovibrio sp. MK-HDV]|jgi:hypothetical protein|uniref:BREX-1 system phosphatase PglZ type B n=1 Tax=Halodesulfovibrio sp. MK-HDV TaxID=2599925 RepID=UPI001371935A|nr:BREX-1 system phosphatase PglZ type B [Halodesulfovibrio sp. MK-HDV]KAF1075923.1 hypothetical protein MKHDV_01721 [Halodesulfovibrio sp. MK-HDV]